MRLTSRADRTGKASMLRQFDAYASEKLDIHLQRLRDNASGPFSKSTNETPSVKANSRRIQGANAHCLNERRPFFVNRPSLTNADEAQKWCLTRLYSSWRQSSRDDDTSTAPSIPPRPVETAHNVSSSFIEKAFHSRPIAFSEWLPKTGLSVWRVHWNHMSPEEYIKLIAPAVWAASVYDASEDLDDTNDLVNSDSHKPLRSFDCPDHIEELVRRSQAVRGEDVFMGWEDNMPRL